MRRLKRHSVGGAESAFTLMEVVVATAIMGVTFVSLYAGMTYGFSVVRMSREDMRATQILIEKMETMRLYNWDQINTGNFIPEKFQATYSPVGSTNEQGIIYYGEVKIENCNLSSNYEDRMKKVTVELSWDSSNKEGAKNARHRTLSTYVAENGLHKHVF
jgi:uncharacterized protein (TIGR02598 family)